MQAKTQLARELREMRDLVEDQELMEQRCTLTLKTNEETIAKQREAAREVGSYSLESTRDCFALSVYRCDVPPPEGPVSTSD